MFILYALIKCPKKGTIHREIPFVTIIVTDDYSENHHSYGILEKLSDSLKSQSKPKSPYLVLHGPYKGFCAYSSERIEKGMSS